jgi:signal transduction histidine kinase
LCYALSCGIIASIGSGRVRTSRSAESAPTRKSDHLAMSVVETSSAERHAGPRAAHGNHLSTLPADPRHWRLASGAVLVCAALFIATAPFARTPLPEIWAFIPTYQAALIVIDSITAMMLFGQFSFQGARALLALAGGYLFSALLAMLHALSFPGLFADAGLLGAGEQTTAWLYFIWHAGFPAMLLLYGKWKSDPGAGAVAQGGIVRAIALTCLGVLAAALAIAWLVTTGHDALPVLMEGNRDGPAKVLVATATWLVSLTALVYLWRRKPHTLLDIWCMAVACVWMFDTALAAVLNGARFDLGFYAGRVYGLLASSFVLIVLLLEHASLYASLVAAHTREQRERARVEERSAELVIVNKELEAFTYSISHDLRAPLRAIGGYAAMLDEDHAKGLDAEGGRLLNVIRNSARRMEEMMEDLLRFSRMGRQPLQTAATDLRTLFAQCAKALDPSTAARNIRFVVADLGWAQVDATLLRHVAENLLSNAVKYTRGRDPAIVEIGRLQPERPGEPEVYFVRDNGAGFEMKHADRLFGVFQRLHPAKQFEGNGVGLAIVQRIIQRHGGRIWAEAKPGEGATFYFTLRPGSPTPAVAGDMPARVIPAWPQTQQ